MAEQEKNNPEKQIKAPEKQGTKPPEDADKAVLEKFEEKQKESMKQVEDMFEKRISGSKLGEIALVEVRQLKENEKARVKKTYEDYKDKYQKETEKNTSQRDAFAQQFLKEAENEADYRVKNVQAILDLAVKGEYIDEKEAVILKKSLLGMKDILDKDQQSQEILIKLEGHQDLNEQDYFKIISLVNPMLLTDKDAKPQQKFDSTTAGVMIGFMSPSQRYQLVEKFMGSYKKEQTGAFIDGLLRTGILTVAQGEDLFQKAVTAKAVDENDFREIYEKRLSKGFYVDEAKKVREVIDQEVQRMKGMYAVNTFERYTGAPLLGAGMVLHSIFWLLTNVLASGGNWRNLSKNPYIWAALGEGALGLEISTGGVKRGTGTLGIGSGLVSRGFEKLTEKEGPKTDIEKNAFTFLEKLYTTYPEFGHYLEKGGALTILNLRKKKYGEGLTGKSLVISYDELLKAETDENRKTMLQKVNQDFPKEISAQINGVAEAEMVFNMQSQADFDRKLDYIKQGQGLAPTPPQIKS